MKTRILVLFLLLCTMTTILAQSGEEKAMIANIHEQYGRGRQGIVLQEKTPTTCLSVEILVTERGGKGEKTNIVYLYDFHDTDSTFVPYYIRKTVNKDLTEEYVFIDGQLVFTRSQNEIGDDIDDMRLYLHNGRPFWRTYKLFDVHTHMVSEDFNNSYQGTNDKSWELNLREAYRLAGAFRLLTTRRDMVGGDRGDGSLNGNENLNGNLNGNLNEEQRAKLSAIEQRAKKLEKDGLHGHKRNYAKIEYHIAELPQAFPKRIEYTLDLSNRDKDFGFYIPMAVKATIVNDKAVSVYLFDEQGQMVKTTDGRSCARAIANCLYQAFSDWTAVIH